MNLLSQLLSSQARAEIFRLLFTKEMTSMHLRELQRKSGLSIGSIQQEVAQLKKLDLITLKRDGNRVCISANSDHPIYNEICNLVSKTSGIIEQIRQTLGQVKGIERAFVFGSYAKGLEKSHSDIDLIIIGSVGLRSLSIVLREISQMADREINPHIYSKKSWNEKIRSNDHFIKTVLKEKKIFLVGDDDVSD